MGAEDREGHRCKTAQAKRAAQRCSTIGAAFTWPLQPGAAPIIQQRIAGDLA